MLWILSVAAATSPEVCDGIDNDLNGAIDDPASCGTTSLVDPLTGHAYTSPGEGTAAQAAAVCDAIGYHPADPGTPVENALFDAGYGSGELYWIGIVRIGGATVDSTGATQSYSDYVGMPGDSGCTLLGNTGGGTEIDWLFIEAGDCSAIHPILCEADCNRSEVYLDGDGDGVGAGSPITACGPPPPGSSSRGDDCDDQDADRNPFATETCNQADDDCNGQVDEGLLTFTVYPDLDGDGRGAAGASGTQSCGVIPGTSLNQNDCDDTEGTVYNNAPEVCDGLDNDCDGTIDDNATPIAHYLDGDGDGFGTGTGTVTCTPGPGYVRFDGDCDDLDDLVFPGADEVCNGEDDDCNGTVDDAPVNGHTYYDDTDGDGAGDPDLSITACSLPVGFVANDVDCAPDDGAIHPSAPEACVDGIDNDCDLLIDHDDDDFTDTEVTFWIDQDGDGSGVPGADFVGCSGTQPNGYVAVTEFEDCNDAEPQIRPGLPEVCDGLDNDCSGVADNGLVVLDYWPDLDGDLFGDRQANAVSSCQGTPGLVRNQLDCDDTSALRNPDATELCDGVDDDCDTLIDEDLPQFAYFPDLDGDGYGGEPPVTACASPGPGYTTVSGDCADADPAIHPDATEDPTDGIDSDCDGAVEEPAPADTDGDGVPDAIDPTPDGSDPPGPVEPPTPVYGCGCTVRPPEHPWMFGGLWARRR